MEYFYDFEVPAEEPEAYVRMIQKEVAEIGGVVTATGPGLPNTDHVVLVAHPDKSILASYIRQYYREGGFDEKQIEIEVLKIREA